MPYKIAIASGKGGTGKTTVSVNLSYFINKFITKNLILVDCDVEEPNDLLFFPDAKKIKEEEITQLIPEIDNNLCTYCRKCVEYCEYNAIVVIPPVEFAEVNKSLCHSCGACIVACQHNAMPEKPHPIGKVVSHNNGIGNGLIEGKLKIGSAMQTMLIKELKKKVPQNNYIIIYDAPPGTSCPVVETVADADYVILVTEPTPFGLHDLKLMIELLEDIKLLFGVIINKAGIGFADTNDYLNNKGIDILGEIPFMKEYASKYAVGNLFTEIPAVIESTYMNIIKKLESKINIYEGNNHIER